MMNRIMVDDYPIFELYQALRQQLMQTLSDDDLRYTPGGENPTLGELCRDIGAIQDAYIQSFKTFKLDFAAAPTPPVEIRVLALTRWFEELDRELAAALTNLSEEDVENRYIERTDEFQLLPRVQLEVYKEALLIFYGKVSVYLKAMGKPRPPQWEEWIA
jgi:hypothetical protein